MPTDFLCQWFFFLRGWVKSASMGKLSIDKKQLITLVTGR